MNKQKPIRSEEELVDAFDQLFDEIPFPRTPEEIDEYIREAGIIPNNFGEGIVEIITKALEESPLNWRNRALKEIDGARERLEEIDSFKRMDRSDILSMIDNLIEKIKIKNPALAPVHYRNRTDLSKEDLASLLREILFIAEQSNIELDMGE